MRAEQVKVRALEALEDPSEDFTLLQSGMGATGGLGATEVRPGTGMEKRL